MKVKYTPRNTVRASLWTASSKLPTMIAWWDQVTLTPEERRIIVLSSGTENGLKGWIPAGGHCEPISTFGDNLLWKKAQKNEEKNIISEIINRTIPQRIPVSTIFVWSPWYVLSRETSRHHWKLTSRRRTNLNENNITSLV